MKRTKSLPPLPFDQLTSISEENVRNPAISGEPLHIVVELSSSATMTVVNRTIQKRLDAHLRQWSTCTLEEKDEDFSDSDSDDKSHISNLPNEVAATIGEKFNRFVENCGFRTDIEPGPESNSSDSASGQFMADTSDIRLPVYGAGLVFSSQIFDFLLCQSYFSPEIIRFLETLLHTVSFKPSSPSPTCDVPLYSSTTSPPPPSSLDQFPPPPPKDMSGRSSSFSHIQRENKASLVSIPVPPDFVGCKFIHLFSTFVTKHNAISIALYRRNHEILPYVYCGL